MIETLLIALLIIAVANLIATIRAHNVARATNRIVCEALHG